MTLDPRAWLAVGALAAAGAGGWFVNGWRKDAEIERLTAVHSSLVSAANAASLAAMRAEQDRYKQRADDQARIDNQRMKELNDAKKELERMRTGVANGTIGLRVNATCARIASDVPARSGTPGLGDATGPELTPDARRDYFALRQGIIEMTKQLEAAQDILRLRSKQ